MRNGLRGAAENKSPDTVRSALEAIRKHLGMEVAYISEFVDNRSVFREVDAPGLENLIKVGDSHSLDDVYCRHILAGTLPELMADTGDYAFAQSLPITKAVPIGAHMSVPVRAKDGSALGMFCCLSPHPNKSLNDRDLKVMRVFADMAADQIADRREAEQTLRRKRAEIERVIEEKAFTFVYQPIWDFRSNRPTGFEALCRFSAQPYRSPDKWFGEAFESGCGIRLELAVLEMALEGFRELPEDVYLSLNASPETILSGGLTALLRDVPMHRLVLEVTEHAPVSDYSALTDALAPLRAAGARIAIDDAGAGYASMQHIIRLNPDLIKLDMSLTRAIDTDPARRALASALIFFARETGCIMIAEGVETVEEQDILKILGVPRGQGYFLGRPVDLQSALALVAEPALRKSA